MSISPEENIRLDEIAAMSEDALDHALLGAGCHPGPGSSREDRECQLFLAESETAYDAMDEADKEAYLRQVGLDPAQAMAQVAMLASMLRQGFSHEEVSRMLRTDLEETRRRLRDAHADGTRH